MTWIIETQKVTKYYPALAGWKSIVSSNERGKCAVEGIDLQIKAGELFGLVGPNGAGKTTLIKMLSTLIIPTSGEIHIGGYDIRDEANIKKTIGLATSDERSFYWRLTGRQNLRFFASLHDLSARDAKKRIDETLAMVNLTEVADNRFHTYSTGMRQRLTIARAMLMNPKIIFMDEPTKGLDPPSAANLQKLIRQHLVEDLGITVLLSSHHLKEVEDICDRIAVMNNGRIQGCGTMAELRALLGPVEQYRLEVTGIDTSAIAQINANEAGLAIQRTSNDGLIISFSKDAADDRLTRMIKLILEHNGKIQAISCDPVSLYTIFDHLTKKMAEDPVELSISNDQPAIGETTKNTPGGEDHLDQAQTQPALNRDQSIYKRIRSTARTSAALIKRDMLSETSYRFSFAMQIVEIFLTVVAIYFLSQMFGEEMIEKYLKPYGGDYFAFAITGIAFYSYFNIGFSNYGTKLREAQSTGTLEAMLATPADFSTIVLGSSLWMFIMTTFRVGVFLGCGAFMFPGGLASGNFPLALLFLLLAIGSASSFGIIAASFIVVVKRGDPISWIFKSASWLLGGVVFPVAVLPDWLQKLSNVLPTVHALQGIRLALLKSATFVQVLPEIGALCIFCFLLLPISLQTLKYAVKRAKREGSLTHY